MATLTLKSWPFPENHEAELVWFGSPFMDYKGNWRIRVAFRTSAEGIKVVSYPWGTIPYLRIGQIYSNGTYDQITPMSGSAFQFTIDAFNHGTVTNGFKLPKRLIDFGKIPELGLQNIIQYQTNGLTYCIPVIELIRAMLINSRYLAYYLLQPHGLDLLIDNSYSLGKTLHLDLSNRVPAKLATDSNVRHLSWIYSDPMIRSLWDSVYQNMFIQAVKSSPYNPSSSLKKGVPLNIDLPSLGSIEMHTRGVQFIDYVLVKEIIAIGGFQHPSNEILFWHPSKKRREWSSGDKTIRMIPGSKNTDYVLNDQSDNAKEDSNQDILETSPTIMRFANYPVVETRRSSVRHSNTGNEVFVSTGRGGKHAAASEEVSTHDSMVGGDTPPIDFQTLETIPASEAIGLELFFQMIEMLKKKLTVNVRMSVVRVPPGRRFSVCMNGSRRTCAIIQVTNGASTSYIVEVARPVDWSISTLILRPMNQLSFRIIERNIKQLLDGLVLKSGHWDQSVLNQCDTMNIEKLKHYQSDTIREWASRLASKLMT
ncbi:Tn7-like element transposition protein TnsE [Paenibacillus alkaliterrae]|uniref:Tn7-like element transposition protein TnsE n=1 Tax=Paenibacillus alkaliterrae TaxID=320909 RepID=UPI001F246B10|nr:Tn7-like element transposition protein TnsE [Paenibacillus alkaliterrae]MCF2941091.1 Tn7-like element transposition protein TnsE [Paenibacillus alkaliterrae]